MEVISGINYYKIIIAQCTTCRTLLKTGFGRVAVIQLKTGGELQFIELIITRITDSAGRVQIGQIQIRLIAAITKMGDVTMTDKIEENKTTPDKLIPNK